MAQTKNGAKSTSSNISAAELRDFYDKNKNRIDNYASAENILKQFRNVTKNATKAVSTFNKETLRRYLQNIGSNEANLRNLAWYLYYRNQIFQRLVHFYGDMFCLDCRSVIPNYDLVKDNQNNKKILKSFQDTIDQLDLMNIQAEFHSPIIQCFIQDVFYGLWIKDDTGSFIFPIPADYCRIAGRYMTGDYAFAISNQYLRKYPELLEYLPEVFKDIDIEGKKQSYNIVPEEYAVCMKYHTEDWEIIAPVFTPLFNQLISVSDNEDIQAIADAQDIYKLLVLSPDTIGEEPDDFKVDLTLLAQYFDKLINALPDYVSAAISPVPVDVVSFDDQSSQDSNRYQKSVTSVLQTAGGAELLDGANIQGTTAIKNAAIANTEFAISSLLPQISSIVKRHLAYDVTNPCKVKFFPISVYTKQEFKEGLLSSAQAGLAANILAYNACNGLTEKDTLAMNHLANDILDLPTVLRPLQSSYTQSGKDINKKAGRPEAGSNITDEGEASQDKRDRSN